MHVYYQHYDIERYYFLFFMVKSDTKVLKRGKFQQTVPIEIVRPLLKATIINCNRIAK